MYIKVKKIIVSLFLIFLAATNSYSQELRLSLNYTDTELGTILDKIEEQTGFFFLFNEKLFDSDQKITINASELSLNDLLDILFEKTNIKYSIIDNKIILSPEYLSVLKHNPPPFNGTITDENGVGLPGVNIQVEGTSFGTISDYYGKYSLNNINPDAVIIFSFIGYNQQRIPIEGRNSVNIEMVPSISSLEEVIVIGYGTVRKTDLTGSITAVSEKSYRNQPVIRVDDILQGRSAGVTVTNVSGAPGGTTSIRIRGSNSITGNNDPLYVIDGFVGDNMSNINPTDIESIQVLKDASSTAIYGSRGANGVVVITTKKGTSGKPKFSLTTKYYSSTPIKKWPLLNAGEFAQICNERADALEYPHRFTDTEVASYIADGGTDWQNLIFRNAGGEEVQFDYSGGSDALTGFVSGNFLNQDGIIINSYFKRYSLRANIDSRLSDRLRASLKVNFVRRANNNTSGNYNTNSVIGSATAWAPTTPEYDLTGKLTTYDPICSIKTNPVEQAGNDNINQSNTFSANGNFIYYILRGLSLDIGFGVNYSFAQTKTFNQNLLNENPSASRSSNESIFLQNTNLLTYTKTFNDIHNITLTGVAEYQFQQNDSFTANAINLLFPILKYNNLNLAKTYALANTFAKSTIGSYIGRLNYSLKNRYLITTSVRSDRSSKFRGANQRSIFPSIGFGWRISEEDFMRRFPIISNLKLRTSWGQTGSQAIDVYGTVTSYNTSATLASTSWQSGILTPGINIGAPGNDKLKWETTTQTNIGFDLGVLKDRFTLEADYYIKKTTDLLLGEPLPGYLGGGNIFRNVGVVQNSGFEFNLGTNLINTKNISWNMIFNISILKNEVVDLGKNPYIVRTGGAGAGMVNFPEMILKPGYSISSYYGFKSLGIWQVADADLAAKYGQQPGDYRYEDINGDYAFTGEDLQIIGSGIPKKVLGINNTLTYKNFTLNAFLQGMFDYDKWDFAYAQIMIAAADAREYTHRDILNRWSPENPTSRVAAFSKTNVPRIQSSEYIESGNYLRVKNISLQYTLPKRILNWGNLTVMIGAQNLFTVTKYKGLDPETYSNVGTGDQRGGDGGSYPNSKIWTFGLTFGF
jgi:TonB-dependent starch-binding outer membrane protein SusC